MLKKIVFGLVIFVILVVVFNLVTQIFESTKSGERLSQAAENVYKLEGKNKQLKEKLSRVQTYQFLEEALRNKLGLAKPGETVVVIPEEKLKSVLGASQSAQIRLPNWLGWLKVFFK